VTTTSSTTVTRPAIATAASQTDNTTGASNDGSASLSNYLQSNIGVLALLILIAIIILIVVGDQHTSYPWPLCFLAFQQFYGSRLRMSL
jgi:hypothetical protein